MPVNSKKKVRFSQYPNSVCHKTVVCALNGLVFPDKKLKKILLDSYLLNLGILREYARDNGVDELEFLWEIRKNLIDSGTAYDKRQR